MTHSLKFFFLVLNLVNPAVLCIILSTWPASCHVFVKWPVGQKQLDHAMGYTFSLISCNVTTMVTNQSKRFFCDSFICVFVPVLNTWVRKSFDLPEFNQTHNTSMFHPSEKRLLYRYVSPSLVDFLFVLMQVKLGTFLPIHRYAV